MTAGGARPKALLETARRLARRQASWLLLTSLGASACGSEELEGRTFTDVGSFCMTSDGGGSVTFSVVAGPPEFCLSSCWSHTLSCRATLTKGRIDLVSRLETRQSPSDGLRECPTDCRSTRATCELEHVPAGDYQFGFASRVDTATLPLDGSIRLFSDGPCGAMDGSLLPNPSPEPSAGTQRVPDFEGSLD